MARSGAPLTERIAAEAARRRELWDALLRSGGPVGVPPHVLRHLGLYAGQQGIFVDKPRTAPLNGGIGVTLSLLHKGLRYADDLSEDDLLYHYPETCRPLGRDLAEVAATKAAHELRLPVFVIVQPSRNRAVRDVQRAWVEDWDDTARIFLVSLGEEAVSDIDQEIDVDDDRPFSLTEARPGVQRLATARPGQQRFKFAVIRRYGPRCAVCGLDVLAVLDAAHIRPKQDRGADDPRNGLLLCALHHRAWDADLFAIEPTTLAVHVRPGRLTLRGLRITEPSLAHLPRLPHPTALAWRWRRWRQAAEDDRTA